MLRIPLPKGRTLVCVVRTEDEEQMVGEVIRLGVQQKFAGQTAWVRHGLEREGWDVPPDAA